MGVRNLRIFQVTLLSLMLTTIGTAASANERTATPILTVKQEYNDNLFLTGDAATEDFITTVSPRLELRERSERFDASLEGALDAIAYADHNELNAVDQTLEAGGSCRLSEISGLSVDGRYSKDSRVDRDLSTSGLVLGTSTRTQKHVSLDAYRFVSEKTRWSVTAGHDETEYDDPEFADSTATSASLSLFHDLGGILATTTGQGSLTYARYDYPRARIDYYALGLGAEKRLSETLGLFASLGPSLTRTTLTGLPQFDSEKWGVSGEVSLTATGEASRFTLSLSQRVESASGYSGTVNRTAVKCWYQRRLAADWQWGLWAQYFRNKTDAGLASVARINEENWQLSPRLSYRLSDHVDLETSYRHTRIDDRDDDVTRTRNMAMVRLIFRLSRPRPN